MAADELVGYGKALWIGLLVLVLVLVTSSTRKRSKHLPPGPFPWPVIGNIFRGGRHPHQTFTELAKRYGKTMTLYFGSARVLIVSDAQMCKELYTTGDSKFASRPIHDVMRTTFKYMNYGEKDVSIVASVYSQRVRELRSLINSELFTPTKLEMRRSVRMEEIRRMVVAMAARTNEPLDTRDLFSVLALRINCRTSFNKAFLHSDCVPCGSGKNGALDPQGYRQLEEENIKLLATHNLQDMIPLLRAVLAPFGKDEIDAKWKDVTARKVACAELVLDWYRQRGSVPDENGEVDFVETLVRLIEAGKYTPTIARSLILELLTAGSDTIASMLEWMLLELVLHPNCMEKLQAEVDEKFGMRGPVEEDEASQLPYLQCVLKEALRLHAPTAMGIPHANMEDATLGEYQVPAGTCVFTNLWALHRDPKYFGDDVMAFNPDRFLGSELSMNGTNYQYLPFGAGRRICPGRALALRALPVAVATFVHAFEWSAPPGVKLTDNEGEHGLNIRPEHPTFLQVSLRPAASLYLPQSTSNS